MAGMSLLEASKYSTDILQKGVIETMARENVVLELLPFMEIEGNSYQYNVETALPNVAFRAVNAGYEAGVGEIKRESESLVILGGDVALDRFIVQTRSNVNDIRSVQTAMKAKAVANTYSKTFFIGDPAGNSNEFKGLDKRLAATQVVEGDITLDNLNALLDTVYGGADVLVMSKATRRLVMKVLQESNHYIENGTDAFGRPVAMYGGVPIRVVEDSILPEGHIYAIAFGVMEKVCGLQNGGISVRDLGEIDSLPQLITRIEWYCGMAMFTSDCAGLLKPAAVRAAKK